MVIDCHMHVRKKDDGSLDEAYCDWTLEAGDLLGIDVFCVSDSKLQGDLRYEDFHEANERVKQAVARHPARLWGYCFVNPGDAKALDEVTQRVRDEGFVGVKLYHQYRIDEPVQEPLIERCISDASHFVKAAKRYPEAIFIEGHIGGGGDWEWAFKHLREAPSVYLDTSGSVVDEWLVDRCVAELGADRLLFATDMTMEGGVGKVLDADLTETDRTKILGGNFEAIRARRTVS